MTNKLMHDYLAFTANTESPRPFHRWALLSGVAAQLGRRIYIPFGHGNIYPNMYVMLVGVPAARKSTAVKIQQKLLQEAGYKSFAFTKSSREKFLLDLEMGFEKVAQLEKTNIAELLASNVHELDMQALMDAPMFPSDPTSDAFICCDEFVDFIGQKNINFINTLTTLWDNLDKYPERLKNSKSVNIPAPTINLLGGITPVSFAQAMPPEIVGQGFMSRVLLVYGDPPKRKITWPKPPDPAVRAELALRLRNISKLSGQCIIETAANTLIDSIYQNYHNLPDVRLQYYCARRLDHLLKLCMVIAAMKGTLRISYDTVVEANTLLVYTESWMPKALGEFGEAKNAKATQKIIEILTESAEPLTGEAIWVAVSQDLARFAEMQEIINNLALARKILVSGTGAVMLNRTPESKNVIGVNFQKYLPEINTLEEM